jgi:fatty-acyl-CoA synthase
VGLIGENEAAYLAAYLGIMRAGCVVVPVNVMLDAASVRDQLDLVDVRTVLVGTVPREIRDGLEGGYRVLELSGPFRGPLRPRLPAVVPGSTSCIMLTSGSTGRPKGVEHTHGSIAHTMVQMAAAFPFDRTDRGVAFLPFYTCIPEQVLPTLCRGGSLEILPRFDIDRVADACARGATTFDAVPTIISRLIERAPLHALANLRWILFASEPMPVPLLERWWELLPGVETHQFYGMTELVNLTAASHAMLRADPATVGRPFPTTHVTLERVDADGSGEITASSPSRMRGYFGDPATTQTVLTASGALRTGDLGRVDDRGFVFLTGRSKDIIITGGLNVAPAEIEAVAFGHGSLQEAMVVGIPSERWGETPVVVAVAKAGSVVTAEALLLHCRQALPGFKRPSAAALVPSLPTTGIGKGDKATVKQLIADGVIKLVSA